MTVTKMTKKLLLCFLTFAVVLAFSQPIAAQNTAAGKIQALDRVAKKITIGGTEYMMSDEVAQTSFKVGDAVEATLEGNVVRRLILLLQ